MTLTLKDAFQFVKEAKVVMKEYGFSEESLILKVDIIRREHGIEIISDLAALAILRRTLQNPDEA